MKWEKMIFKVKYTVGFFIEEKGFVEEQKKCLVHGEAFSDAVRIIEEREGNELMSIEEITPLTLDTVILIEDEKVWKAVIKDIENNAIW